MSSTLPPDHLHRVYAGVLGKIIGVYLGRPFEGWPHERILRELGEINYYVHDRRGVPLIVTDDDITGTFTFVRALEDSRAPQQLSAREIGHTWLNYIIENRSILWWGGVGMSTEHTAYVRLRDGIDAPRSGSIELNGKTVAEQIGAQIFIDGWAMVAPNQPDLAARLARMAGSVSHDGEALHAAVVVAVMESAAFGDLTLDQLLDLALTYIPTDSIIARLIADLRECRKTSDDWHVGLKLIHDRYSYAHYPSNCHVVPNHAVIILALLWGDDDFQRSLMIANTAGYDTDCNSGNVGCLLGIKNGLAGIDAGPDFRGPVADRLLLPTAEPGSCINDAANVAVRLANMGRALAGLAPERPKDGARFHFSLPGSVQGFTADPSRECAGTTRVSHADGRLRIAFDGLAADRIARATTPTFASESQTKMIAYDASAAPTLYPGQVIRAAIAGCVDRGANVRASLVIKHYDDRGQLAIVEGPGVDLSRDAASTVLSWVCPQTSGPIAEIGVSIRGESGAAGLVDVDWLRWDGAPTMSLSQGRGAALGKMALHQWAKGCDVLRGFDHHDYIAIHNRGRGLAITGTHDWRDYTLSATVTPLLSTASGVAARVGGLRKYYALVLRSEGVAELVRVDDEEHVLATARCAWALDKATPISLEVRGTQLVGKVGDTVTLSAADDRLTSGGVALLTDDGGTAFDAVQVVAVDAA